MGLLDDRWRLLAVGLVTLQLPLGALAAGLPAGCEETPVHIECHWTASFAPSDVEPRTFLLPDPRGAIALLVSMHPPFVDGNAINGHAGEYLVDVCSANGTCQDLGGGAGGSIGFGASPVQDFTSNASSLGPLPWTLKLTHRAGPSGSADARYGIDVSMDPPSPGLRAPPAGTWSDPQLRDGIHEGNVASALDIVGAWLDDPWKDEGSLQVGLHILDLNASAPVDTSYEYRLAWTVIGGRFGVVFFSPGGVNLEANQGVRLSASLVRLNSDDSVKDRIMSVPATLDAVNGSVSTSIPFRPLGTPTGGAAFSKLHASSFTRSSASSYTSAAGALDQAVDDATEQVRPFVLRGAGNVSDATQPSSGRDVAPATNRSPSQSLPSASVPAPAAPESPAQGPTLASVLARPAIAGGALAGLALIALPLAVIARRKVRPTPRLSKYRIVRALGSGAFGTTYLAVHEDLHRTVVLKALHPEWRADQEALRRFQREAQLLAQIDHPNVTKVYDVERAPEANYLVMEHVDGGSLADRLARGSMPLDEAARVTEHVLAGLACIHAQGVLHRDIKLSNVLLTRDGVAKIADFGVAQDRAIATTVAAGPGASPGTPLYMAPEQLEGRPASVATDLYAVGAMFHELATGRYYLGERPSTEAQLRRAVMDRDAGALPEGLPSALRAWLARALAKDPAARFGSADEMLRALRLARDTDASG